MPLVHGLTDRQARLLVLFGTLVTKHPAEALQRLVDDDVAQAAEALAATLETADRGIVYEHQPASLPAARLMTEIKTRLNELSGEGGSGLDRDAAVALRRIERGAREIHRVLDGGDTAFQQLLARVITPASEDRTEAGAAEPAAPPGPVLVTP